MSQHFLHLYIFPGKYYAVEDMLTTNPVEKFGQVTLKQVNDKNQVWQICDIFDISVTS